MTHRVAAAVLALPLVLSASCYESSTPLGPSERGVVDVTLAYTWSCKDPENPSNSATLTVTPFDEHRYYAEWREEDKVSRYAAHSTDFGGERLFSIRELKSGPQKWLFVRAKAEARRLVVSVVNEKALKASTDAAAIREVGRRAKDDSIYETWADCARAE